MLAFNQITHCANENCLAIYLTPPKYLPLMSFCPACRSEITEQVVSDLWSRDSEAVRKEAYEDDDFETELDGPGRC